MLHRVFRTGERRSIAILIAIILIFIGVFILNIYNENKRYEEQAVMAENYLEEGNYKEAVEAYIKAMAIKTEDDEAMSMDLARAYVGLNEYDKAIETLRSSYKITGSLNIKKMIEEVISQKTDYDFNQIIAHADKYYANKEYDKAIIEYESAKNIKSKEIISYQRIAESHLAKGEIELARTEVEEGLMITQNEELNNTLALVDHYSKKKLYDQKVFEASEYIYQENYTDGILKYQEAIVLLPDAESAYAGLSDVYMKNGEYEKTISLLQNALKLRQSDMLKGILDTAVKLESDRLERKRILAELYEAINILNIEKIKELMNSSFYKEKIAIGEKVYYSLEGEQQISSGNVMIIYDDVNVFLGELKDGMKKGNGIHFILDNDMQGYYFYKGEWSNDIPNGSGMVREVNVAKGEDDLFHTYRTETEGRYNNGVESGAMHKSFYTDDYEMGNVSYNSQEGVPIPIKDKEGIQIIDYSSLRYAIGILYKGSSSTTEYYYVDPGTKWGIRPFV